MNRPYKIVMSKGDSIQIDSDEIDKVIRGLQEGGIVVTRSGVFNPSFYISIVKDTKRWNEFIEDIKYEDNKVELRKAGCKRLNNIFSEIEILKLKVGNKN